MRKKSEYTQAEKISATQASRGFSKLLDKVESGGRFLIHRRGRDVSLLAPAPIEGRRASECLALLRGRSAVQLDDRFGADLVNIVSAEPTEERPHWDS